MKLSVQSDCLISTKNDPSRVPQMHSLLNGILVINGLRKFILSCRGFSGGHGQKLPREFQLKHFGNFAVYLSFFPKLIAGPIEKSVDFLPQLKEKITLKYDNISNGLSEPQAGSPLVSVIWL